MTFVIAEAASTHDGDINKALRLVQIAADAGANACKFQFWSDADRLAARRRADKYRDIYRRYQMPAAWLPVLRAACDEREMDFLCTTFLPEDIAVVEPFVEGFKVASFEAADSAFLDAHDAFNKPVVVSTGMMDWDAVDELVARVGNLHALLHCVSAYPCGQPDLSIVTAMRARYDVRVGFSDHTANVLTGALAVAAGAHVAEVHFKAPDTDPANQDCAVAVPDLAQYVANIRYAERMMGDGVKRATAEEAEMMNYRVA